MSTVDADVTVPDAARGAREPELTEARVARVGDLEVRRGAAAPHIGLQTVTAAADSDTKSSPASAPATVVLPR